MFDIIFKIIILVLVLDSLYINLISNNYNSLIKKVQGSNLEVNVTGALFCYSCIVYMLYYFIIRENKSVYDAFILGFCTYGIYEFTNMAILKNWSSLIVYIDVLWGGILYAATTYILKNKYI